MNGFADKGFDEDNFAQSSSVISSFDAFPKTKQSYLTQTRNGTAWTIFIVVFCVWLTSTEFWRWMEGDTHHHFSVEKGVAHDLQINLDLVMAMKCEDVAVNVQDASGDRILASEMLRLDPTRWEHWKGGLRRDAFGRKVHKNDDSFFKSSFAEAKAKQYMDTKKEDVHDYLARARLRAFPKTPKLGRGEEADSCRIYGSVEGNKVQGDFHITARGHGYVTQDQPHLDHNAFNFSHHINEMSFGRYFPSITQPLDSAIATTDHHFFRYQYYLSVVPTIYTDAVQKLTSSTPPPPRKRRPPPPPPRNPVAKDDVRSPVDQVRMMLEDQAHRSPSEPDAARDRSVPLRFLNFLRGVPRTVYTNQYAVTEQSRPVPEAHVPGIFFKYDIEPILLTVSEEWGGALGLLVRCVNVVAGVLVAGGWLVALADWVHEVVGRRRKRGLSLAGGGGLLTGSEKSSVD